MGKHTPLPTDPVAKAVEKKRRFAVYRSEWQRRRRESNVRKRVAKAKGRQELARAARRLNIDLCLELADLTAEQLRKNIATAEGWIAEL